MSKLTKAMRDTLNACPDWSASFEIMHRRRLATGEIVSPYGLRTMLGRLRNLGLVEYGPPNDTYRITDLGRSALGEQPEVKE